MKLSCYSYCKLDDDIHLMTNNENVGRETVNETSNVSATLSISISLKEQETEITLKNCTNVYFAGYITIKYASKFFYPHWEQMTKNWFFNFKQIRSI